VGFLAVNYAEKSIEPIIRNSAHFFYGCGYDVAFAAIMALLPMFDVG